MLGDDENAEVGQFLAPRRRQAETVGAPVGRLVRTGHDVERQDEVVD